MRARRICEARTLCRGDVDDRGQSSRRRCARVRDRRSCRRIPSRMDARRPRPGPVARGAGRSHGAGRAIVYASPHRSRRGKVRAAAAPFLRRCPLARCSGFSEQLRRSPADALRKPVVLRRYAVHHRSLALGVVRDGSCGRKTRACASQPRMAIPGLRLHRLHGGIRVCGATSRRGQLAGTTRSRTPRAHGGSRPGQSLPKGHHHR